jgi:2',3'-cyclic-nucleotide 2'-phosphodiesterase
MAININVLFIGDLVGKPGCAMLEKHLPSLKKQFDVDVTIVNGENSASDGRGISPQQLEFFRGLGINVITTGNHVWAKREIYPFFADSKDLLRPINFPSGCPGTGITTVTTPKGVVAVINVQGRVFMRELLGCPFRALDSALTFVQSKTNCICVDMHAEATAEKVGVGNYVDGRVSAVIGTHSHVQTADERILPEGTAYITDVGMVGSLNSMIGMKTEIILKHMLTQMPVKFAVETEGPFILNGAVVSLDAVTGKADSIERISLVDEELQLG